MTRVVRIFTTPLPALMLLGVFLLAGGSTAAVQYTSQPAFCTTCHEMKPYYDAWHVGAHKDVSCIACHVDPGTVAQTEHKVVALKEVFDHFATSPKFPTKDVVVPDARCLACHKNLPAKTATGFNHALHVKQGGCVSCHQDVGHKVNPDTLKQAGILDTKAVIASAAASGSADTSGTHVPINCTRCHSLATTACGTCHQPPHPDRGTCTICHKAGPAWVFTHPSQPTCTDCHKAPAIHYGPACGTCHNPAVPFAKTTFSHTPTTTACGSCHATAKPAKHVSTTAECSSCHPDTGKDWKFTHPASTACASCHAAPGGHFRGSCANCHSPSVAFTATKFTHNSTSCADCHNPPSNHRTSGCYTCHRNTGQSWAFTHPGSTACTSCHSRPSGHFTGSCANCHAPSQGSFAASTFRHTSSTSCQTCHSRPSGHNSGTCYTCHRNAGRSWAFSHPASTACSSCHRAPSSHFGTDCSSCHSPSRAWTSATFNHPSIPGNHHTYRSFACVNCHPSSPPAYYCTCHNGHPPTGD